ncbi:MAG: outer membrane protein assembly factor BamD [Candidatus Hydrogenedentota bacterium]|nr:MAG: outer membrane protein assembly factor BamD [Candidatus Hydrogenedentota bacterium]
MFRRDQFKNIRTTAPFTIYHSVTLQEAWKILGLPNTIEKNKQTQIKTIIKQAYHEKALMLHPDKGGNHNDFAALQNAYDFLLQQVEKSNAENTFSIFFKTHPEKKSSDDFSLYKEACSIFSEAFELYFAKPRPVNLDPLDPDYLQLKERLLQAKHSFGKLLKEYPKSIFVPDSIEKIQKINIWIKQETSPDNP